MKQKLKELKAKRKTKTLGAAALVTLAAGSVIAASLFYYSYRSHRPVNPSTSSSSSTSTSSSTSQGQLAVSPSSYNFGDVNVGDSETTTITASNNGSANLTLNTISISGDGFSQGGGTCSDNQTLTPNSSCTITIQFAPTESEDYSGTLTIAYGDNRTASVSLKGGEDEDEDEGESDLIVDELAAPTYINVQYHPFGISLTIKNQGSESAGSFTVTIYQSESNQSGGYVITKWNISGLAAGESVKQNFNKLYLGDSVSYSDYYFVVEVDSGDDVAETNEANNVSYQYFTILR